MDIRDRVNRLLGRLPGEAQYPTQGCVLFVDLEQQTTRRAYLPVELFETVLSNRGGNMALL